MIILNLPMPTACEAPGRNNEFGMISCPLKNSCTAYKNRYLFDRDMMDYYAPGCPIVGSIPEVHGDIVDITNVRRFLEKWVYGELDYEPKPDDLLSILDFNTPVLIEGTK